MQKKAGRSWAAVLSMPKSLDQLVGVNVKSMVAEMCIKGASTQQKKTKYVKGAALRGGFRGGFVSSFFFLTIVRFSFYFRFM